MNSPECTLNIPCPFAYKQCDKCPWNTNNQIHTEEPKQCPN